MDGANRISAWDANASGYAPFAYDIMVWARNAGLDVFDAYRVDVYLLDAPFARVWRYARNADGKLYDVGGGPATLPPVDVLITDPPPERLRFTMLR